MSFLEFAMKALELKDIERTGWKVRKVSKPESVADHSFFLALLCSLYAEQENLNEQKCIKLALFHDLHETICGDICSREFEHEQEISNKEKEECEVKAIHSFSDLMPEKQKQKFKSLALEFIEQKTPEAKFVRDLDLIEMCLQVLFYKKADRIEGDNSDFFRKTERELCTRTARDLFSVLKKEFEKAKENK